MTDDTMTFFELSGSDARDALSTFGARIAERGTACELMESVTQADLYLLVCRGAVSADDPPAGARSWSFESRERFE